MTLKSLSIKNEYISLSDNIAKDFYIPILSNSIIYKRSVGFFSSSILSLLTVGLCQFVKNGGKMELVVSPHLSSEDIEQIDKGYKNRDSIIKEALIKNLSEPKNKEEFNRLNLLANLISSEILNIKIAFTKNGMYHEKLGIVEDTEGNKIVFTGSANESANALLSNYEAIDVFCSWKGDDERISDKIKRFESIWNDNENNLQIINADEVSDFIVQKYKKGEMDLKIDEEFLEKFEKEQNEKTDFSTYSTNSVQTSLEMTDNSETTTENDLQIQLESHFPIIPKNEDGNELLYDYQNEAIENWLNSDSCGIFDMATGTGKTFTGLGALTRLSQKLNNNLAVIICCPYQHLVEQWVEDIEKFNMKPIVAYGSSSQKDWKDRLENAIELQKIENTKRPFFCLISTNATFSLKFIQSQINKITSSILLIVDEAHNFGSSSLSKHLDERFKYRLALSATLERHNDNEGTSKLYKFFGQKCIEYTMERAIKEKKLTPYKYYPIVVYLDDDELDEFHSISKEISQCCHSNDDEPSEYAKMLMINRARLIAGAKNKIESLKEQIEPYKEKSNLLVYCGATKIKDEENDEESEIRQITAVTKMLGIDLGMSVRKFTSEEDIKERQIIKEDFVNKNLQAIVAIKCLDEGVNIPGIETAFILASTTNPKEYIQRRGRVLRLSKDKKEATIYDFVTLPRPLDSISGLVESQMIGEKGFVQNEIRRVNEFGHLSKNPMDSKFLIEEITEAYNLDLIKILEKEETNYE